VDWTLEVNESTSDYSRELIVWVGGLHVDLDVALVDAVALGQGLDDAVGDECAL
jgi:hypothetical protein